jgi:6-pyruvoyltetrahydropterin/6-carboxytetrahydropterin synthase
MFFSKKFYGPECGYSIAYRQWKADSNCRLIHGYSIGILVEFQSPTVDVRNWVVDFGGMKTFKEFLDDHFDHTMLVASDDPEFETFEMLHKKGLCKMVEVERTGCEGLSKFLFEYLNEIWLPSNTGNSGIKCSRVEIFETPKNSAGYSI